MIRIYSLDEMLERAAEDEISGDDMTVNTCSQEYVSSLLEGVPDEGPVDLVELFRRTG